MIVVREPADVWNISDPHIRTLVQLRLNQLGNFTDEDGQLIVVEPGDSLEALERGSKINLLYDPFSEAYFGDPDFTPLFDFIEEHEHAYELHIDTGDDGIGTTFFIAKAEGISGDLLAMCEEYATPAIVL